jgi:(p)ppGpp synthase/HD superfamily hydrolase
MSEMILEAAVCAAEAHSKQKRKTSGEPYVNHVLRVAHNAKKAGLSDEAVSAALLHDAVEDTDLTLDEIAERFPERVAFLVKLMTQWWSDYAPVEVKISERPKYYGEIAKDEEAMAIKLLDRADNLIDMARMLPKAKDWAARYLHRSKKELEMIFEKSSNDYAKAKFTEALEILDQSLARGRYDFSKRHTFLERS